MIRVLIVDDSPTARSLLKELLNSDPGIEVVGTAVNGQEGVEKAKALNPDLVTMDLHMPKMNGFEATKEIMIEAPTRIVIVSSSTRIKDVEQSMMALRAGALTLLRKPVGPQSSEFEWSCRDLIEKIKTMAAIKVVRHRRSLRSESIEKSTSQQIPARQFQAVVIAASTGGPPALSTLLSNIPANFPAPILIVQHIAVGFVEGFVRWLNSVVPATVKLAENDEATRPGVIYIAPQDVHLGVTKSRRITLSEDPPVGGFRPAGDYLFQTASRAYREKLISVILTGMGGDGAEGMKSIHRLGGHTIAQDENTSVVFGMPRVAIANNIVDEVLPIEQIGPRVLNLVTCNRET